MKAKIVRFALSTVFLALLCTVLSMAPATPAIAQTTFTLPGGSLTTTDLNAWGGTDTRTYDIRFDFSAGPTTITVYEMDLTDIWYEGKWPWPPLPESQGAQARFGITANGFWSLHSIHSAIGNGGGSWDQQSATWDHDDGFRKYLIQNQWSGTTPGVTVGNHQYNVEAYIPRMGAGSSVNDPAQVTDRGYNTFDMKITYTPAGTPGQYQVQGWVRLHKAASSDEMAIRPGTPDWGSPYTWVWNKAVNNQAGPEDAWVPFYDGSWVISGDYTSARPYVQIMNWGVPQTRYHTFSWDSVVIEGTPAAASEVWVDDDWTELANGSEVSLPGGGTGYVGYNAFATIQEGINSVSGSTVHVAAGTYGGTIDIDGLNDLAIIGENRDTVIWQPASTLSWAIPGMPGYDYRQAAARVVGSTNVTLQNMTMDFDLIKGNWVHGVLYWDSTGMLDNNILKNMSLPDTSAYYEVTSYIRAPSYTDASRASVFFTNNTFIDTGRLGIVTHDYVNATISDNTFSKTAGDFGYAIELGSKSVGMISGNTIYGFDTPAASDGSNSAGIYIENAFTGGATGLTKNVLVENNEVYDCQWGLYVGNEFDGFAGDVDINVTLNNNNFHDNDDGGAVLTDEDKEHGSSVSVSGSGNTLANNGDYGYYIFTWGDGDITVNLTQEIITGHSKGVVIEDFGSPSSSSYSVSITQSNISGNTDYGFDNTVSSLAANASGNWWGDSSGPGGSGNSVSANVDYTPWLDNGTDTAPSTPGFQGDFSTLHVDDDSPQTGSTGRIQEGIDMVSGSTVHVAAGTYNEGVTVTPGKDVAFVGAGCDDVTWVCPAGGYCIDGSMSGYTGPMNYEVSGFTFDIRSDPDAAWGAGIGIRRAHDGPLSLSIHDNCFIEDLASADDTHWATSMLLCHNRFAGRDGSGNAAVRVYNNIDKTLGGMTMSNSQAYDIYDNLFDGCSDAIYNGHGCPDIAGQTFGDHHIYNNTFKNARDDLHPNSTTPAIAWYYYGGGGGTHLPSIIERNLFEDNDTAIEFSLDTEMTYPAHVVSNNCFINNDLSLSVYGDFPSTLNAEYNWWGNSSGPAHSGNPGGTGDAVSDYVDFDPWATLTYSGGPQPAEGVTLEATVGNWTLPVEVEFFIGGNSVGSTLTDGNGVASLDIGGWPVGVYQVYAKAGCLQSDTALLAAYDPDGGFVTGGGWINSPAGAYLPDAYRPEPGVVVVTADNVGVDWSTNDTRSGGMVAFVEGPGALPLGTGSLQMATTDVYGSSQAKAQMFNYDHMGTLLTDIESITYATYRDSTSTNPPAQYPAINIEVDYVGDGSSYITLVWEPIYAYGQGNLAVDTWQTWDTMAPSQTGFGGGWWSTKDIPGVCAFNCFVAWDTVVQNNPNAKIKYGFGVNVGSGWTGDFIGAVDALTLVGGKSVTYDFEPVAPPPDYTGKATFGFVSKYKKGATVPEGNTEFVFEAAGLDFHSDSYEWLVVAGGKAKFKGTGTINGAGEYKFMLTAIDADIHSSFTVDRFRIRIWSEDELGNETVIYDNALGDDSDETMTEIGGGSIVIHTKKK